jgi:2',3'-cyclic-nucleotide 2'-phosphodiesterase (5'-nucleotidase family)
VGAKNTAGSIQSDDDYGTPEASNVSIDFNNFKFSLGTATTEYIFGETLPVSPIEYSGRYFDRLTRTKETALGNLFTDGLAWYVREKFEDIDFVFLNGGYVDNTITAGQITVGSLLAITEPDNREDTIVILTLKGSDVKELFRLAADVIHPGRGGYFTTGTQAFGMVSKEVKYTISYPVLDLELANYSLNTHELIEPYCHGKIKDGTLKIYEEAIVDDQEYRIATASHLAMGEDGYLVFAHKGLKRVDTGVPVWHGVAEYIYDHGSITPYLNGSVSIEGGVPLGGIESQPPYRD